MRDLTDIDVFNELPLNVLLIEVDMDEESLNAANVSLNSVVSFELLGRDVLPTSQPSVVICPLFKSNFDAIDVGKQILAHSLKSKLLIVSPPLPRPRMVLGEIRKACPGLSVDFFDAKQWCS